MNMIIDFIILYAIKSLYNGNNGKNNQLFIDLNEWLSQRSTYVLNISHQTFETAWIPKLKMNIWTFEVPNMKRLDKKGKTNWD